VMRLGAGEVYMDLQARHKEACAYRQTVSPHTRVHTHARTHTHMHAPLQAHTSPPTDDRLEHATHQQRSHSPLPLSALLLRRTHRTQALVWVELETASITIELCARAPPACANARLHRSVCAANAAACGYYGALIRSAARAAHCVRARRACARRCVYTQGERL
jgi:hypothetical protein